MSNSTVPKFTVVVGNSYGAGNYAMCGKAYDPRLIVAWPTAKIAVMGGEQAAKVLLQIEKASAKKSRRKKLDEADEKALLNKIIDRYNTRQHPNMLLHVYGLMPLLTQLIHEIGYHLGLKWQTMTQLKNLT